MTEAVRNPTIVLESKNPNSLVFVSNNMTYKSAVLNVPVNLVGDTSAKVATAFFKSRHPTSPVVWRSDDDG